MDTRLKYLLNQYLLNTCTEQERAELSTRMDDPASEAVLLELLEESWNAEQTSPREIDTTSSQKILRHIFDSELVEERVPVEPIRMFPWWRTSVAIILILFGVTGAYLYFSEKKPVTATALVKEVTTNGDVMPGGRKALLTLSNGRKITLDTAKRGKIADEGDARLIASGSGLEYLMANGTDAVLTGGTRSNVINTRRGEEYSVSLSDGSKIWLNAESSLRFPVGFNEDFRRVEITGEAYFEVAKNSSRPFQVLVRGMTIQVLGTHFNVNAYEDEPRLRTTLIEGSVELINGNNRVKIRPGQQGSLNAEGKFDVKTLENPEDVIAWKAGVFSFNDDDMETVLRQVSRWYDVKLDYQTSVKNLRNFDGEIEKKYPLSNVVSILKDYVHLKIDGKNLIVTE